MVKDLPSEVYGCIVAQGMFSFIESKCQMNMMNQLNPIIIFTSYIYLRFVLILSLRLCADLSHRLFP
jgi:hypothetical protein